MKTRFFTLARIIFYICLTSSCCRNNETFDCTISNSDKLVYENAHSLSYKDSSGTESSFVIMTGDEMNEFSYKDDMHEPCTYYDVTAENYAWRLAPAGSPCAAVPVEISGSELCTDCFYCFLFSTEGPKNSHLFNANFKFNNNTFDLALSSPLDSFSVQGHTYDDVLMLSDSSINIWLSLNYGILRYELPGGYYEELIYK
jgi:hypothetical protein